MVKELVVGKSTSKHNNNNVSNGGEEDDDVPIFTSIKTTLQTRKMFPLELFAFSFKTCRFLPLKLVGLFLLELVPGFTVAGENWQQEH